MTSRANASIHQFTTSKMYNLSDIKWSKCIQWAETINGSNN